MNIKPHQASALWFCAAFFLGATVYHYMFSATVSMKVEQAYEQGVEFGEFNTTAKILENFKSADSVHIRENEICFYKYNKLVK